MICLITDVILQTELVCNVTKLLIIILIKFVVIYVLNLFFLVKHKIIQGFTFLLQYLVITPLSYYHCRIKFRSVPLIVSQIREVCCSYD